MTRAKLTIEFDGHDPFTMRLERFEMSEHCDVNTHYDSPTGPPIATTCGPVFVKITGTVRPREIRHLADGELP